jgi:NAD+-dependent protein deacetylase sirtuin 4
MPKPLIRIPYTGPLPPPLIIPKSANTVHGAAIAIAKFLRHPPPPSLQNVSSEHSSHTVLLTGAGISVASGLADYRGSNGTYTQNKAYRPVYYHEFVTDHEWRKRYWARSFLGWTSLNRSKPNSAHYAVGELGKKGLVSSVITQNVDSFHGRAHPNLPVVELHGSLRSLVCINCKTLMPRDDFQVWLSLLNPTWDTFLKKLLESGALDTENPEERRKRGYRTNPDGDADIPGASYITFRYPPCPYCLKTAPTLPDGSKGRVEVDKDGAWSEKSNSGILKPNVIMFGESIPEAVKTAAEQAIDQASKVMVIGSSLATYSAWRLIKKAHNRGMPIGILNLGGVRKEEDFFPVLENTEDGSTNFRASLAAEVVLPEVLKMI